MNYRLLAGILLCSCSLLCYFLLLRGLRKALHAGFGVTQQSSIFRRAVILLTAWIALLGGLSVSGFFTDFSRLPPRPALAVLLPLPVVLAVSFSKTGKQLLRNAPPHWLIYLQSFRIVVEIILWLSVIWGLLPVQMSFGGSNFDLVSGLLALPVGYYCYVKKTWPSVIVLFYNIMGLLLLLNVILVTTFSMPVPFRLFHHEPDSALVAQFPFIFLPGFLVPLAYSMHIFSIRQWSMARKAIVKMT